MKGADRMRELISANSTEPILFTRRHADRAYTRKKGQGRCSVVVPAMVLFAFLSGFAGGCGVREETPTILPDSTLHYTSKLAEDVDAKITFAVTSKGDGAGTRFYIREGARVFASVDILNPSARGTERPLPFHLVWTNPQGVAVFTREAALDPSGNDPVLRSTFTLDPDRRQPGRYSLQIYLHRELIARKFFEAGELADDVRAEIVFADLPPDPETGAYRGAKNSFTIGEDDRVRTYVELVNPLARGSTELEITLEWIDPDGETIFSRSSRLKPGEDPASLTGSMSLAAGTRASGQYTLKAWLFGNLLIGEKKFSVL